MSPVGTPSTLSPKVRNFVVIVAIDGSDPKLMPDLTASLDVELARVSGALVVPREAVAFEEHQPFVKVQRGGGFERQNVSVGDMNLYQVVVTDGLAPGVIVARNIDKVPAR